MEEKELKQEVELVNTGVYEIAVVDDNSYKAAAELTKKVKAAQKKVKEYWEPLRESSYSAYKAIMDKINEMDKPLKEAEKAIKKKMGDYLIKVEEEQARKAEEEALAAKLEAERQRKEAEANMDDGNIFDMLDAMEEAKVLENVSEMTTVAPAVKVEGVSTKKDWEIVSIDNSAVPVSTLGVELRPVDVAAVMSLIRSTKGTVEIPGVVFKEKKVLSIRA